nr:EOG090X0DUK [Sida crystallina]
MAAKSRQHCELSSGTEKLHHGVMLRSPTVSSVRFYSKSKSKGDKKKNVQISESEIAEVINVRVLKKDLEQAVEHLKGDYVKFLSIRSATGSIENLPVEFEGDSYPLQELATISRKSPQLLVINLTALPQALPSVLKSINDSGMGLNPQQDGTTLFIPVPKVTREHRESLAKNAKVLFNKFKDHVREIHNKHVRAAKKQEKTVSGDLIFSVQKQIHALTEETTAEAEKIMIAKQNELLGTKD